MNAISEWPVQCKLFSKYSQNIECVVKFIRIHLLYKTDTTPQTHTHIHTHSSLSHLQSYSWLAKANINCTRLAFFDCIVCKCAITISIRWPQCCSLELSPYIHNSNDTSTTFFSSPCCCHVHG